MNDEREMTGHSRNEWYKISKIRFFRPYIINKMCKYNLKKRKKETKYKNIIFIFPLWPFGVLPPTLY